jgi:hypothetical protein
MLCTPHRTYLGHKTKKTEMGRACSTYEGDVYRFLVREPEGGRPLERPRHR